MKEIRLMVIGAHPDDCEPLTGAIALNLIERGHAVKYVSVTNGNKGHYSMSGGQLAKIRTEESANSGKIGGFEYEVLDIDDCGVTAEIYQREIITKKIREFAPTVIITHRPNDYHPDHRNTSLLIQDSAYLLAVPMFCALTPALKEMPIIMYMSDNFKKPYPFEADLVVDSTKYLRKKSNMASCHKSQFFDWLPWIGDYEKAIPESEEARQDWMFGQIKKRDKIIADKFRSKIIEKYGEKGNIIEFAEAFELSEYGYVPSQKELDKLFNF